MKGGKEKGNKTPELVPSFGEAKVGDWIGGTIENPAQLIGQVELHADWITDFQEGVRLAEGLPHLKQKPD